MTITALTGPVVTFQDGGLLNSSSAYQNADQAPSLFLQGTGLLDPRTNYTYFPDDPNGIIGIGAGGAAIYAAPLLGWLNATFLTADYAPGTASTTSIAAAQTFTSSTTLTLATVSAGNITVNSGPGTTASNSSGFPNAAGTTATTGNLLIDNIPAWVYPAQSRSIALWDPANPPVGRAVTIYTNTASGASFTVSGYDAYGYPITQVIAGSSSTGSVTTGKTFKWVTSVVSSITSSTASVSVGVSDTYGFPMFAGGFSYIDLWFNNTAAFTTASTSFTAGSTATATNSTDVRGTYNIAGALGGAANGAKTLQIWQSISVANISSAAGLFGVTPA